MKIKKIILKTYNFLAWSFLLFMGTSCFLLAIGLLIQGYFYHWAFLGGSGLTTIVTSIFIIYKTFR